MLPRMIAGEDIDDDSATDSRQLLRDNSTEISKWLDSLQTMGCAPFDRQAGGEQTATNSLTFDTTSSGTNLSSPNIATSALSSPTESPPLSLHRTSQHIYCPPAPQTRVPKSTSAAALLRANLVGHAPADCVERRHTSDASPRLTCAAIAAAADYVQPSDDLRTAANTARDVMSDSQSAQDIVATYMWLHDRTDTPCSFSPPPGLEDASAPPTRRKDLSLHPTTPVGSLTLPKRLNSWGAPPSCSDSLVHPICPWSSSPNIGVPLTHGTSGAFDDSIFGNTSYKILEEEILAQTQKPTAEGSTMAHTSIRDNSLPSAKLNYNNPPRRFISPTNSPLPPSPNKLNTLTTPPPCPVPPRSLPQVNSTSALQSPTATSTIFHRASPPPPPQVSPPSIHARNPAKRLQGKLQTPVARQKPQRAATGTRTQSLKELTIPTRLPCRSAPVPVHGHSGNINLLGNDKQDSERTFSLLLHDLTLSDLQRSSLFGGIIKHSRTMPTLSDEDSFHITRGSNYKCTSTASTTFTSSDFSEAFGWPPHKRFNSIGAKGQSASLLEVPPMLPPSYHSTEAMVEAAMNVAASENDQRGALVTFLLQQRKSLYDNIERTDKLLHEVLNAADDCDLPVNLGVPKASTVDQAIAPRGGSTRDCTIANVTGGATNVAVHTSHAAGVINNASVRVGAGCEAASDANLQGRSKLPSQFLCDAGLAAASIDPAVASIFVSGVHPPKSPTTGHQSFDNIIHDEDEEDPPAPLETATDAGVTARTTNRRASTLPNPKALDAMSKDVSQQALHSQGNCQPCAFYYNKKKGCRNGVLCAFCHHEDHSRLTLKKWKKQQQKLTRVVRSTKTRDTRPLGLSREDICGSPMTFSCVL